MASKYITTRRAFLSSAAAVAALTVIPVSANEQLTQAIVGWNASMDRLDVANADYDRWAATLPACMSLAGPEADDPAPRQNLRIAQVDAAMRQHELLTLLRKVRS